MLYHGAQDSLKPLKFPVEQDMITHSLANYSGTVWWLIPPKHPFALDRCSIVDQKTPQDLENRLCHKGKSVFWPFILNQTTNTDFLIQLWRYTLLADSTWTPYQPGDMSYQEAEGSSTPEKPVLPSRRVNVLAIYTESNQSWLAPWVDRYSGGASEDCMPLQWAQKVCIHGVIHQHGQNIALPSRWNHFSRCWGVFWYLVDISFTGGKVFRSSQSVLCTTASGSESLYSWFDSI